jgi:hypothetical protein
VKNLFAFIKAKAIQVWNSNLVCRLRNKTNRLSDTVRRAPIASFTIALIAAGFISLASGSAAVGMTMYAGLLIGVAVLSGSNLWEGCTNLGKYMAQTYKAFYLIVALIIMLNPHLFGISALSTFMIFALLFAISAVFESVFEGSTIKGNVTHFTTKVKSGFKFRNPRVDAAAAVV